MAWKSESITRREFLHAGAFMAAAIARTIDQPFGQPNSSADFDEKKILNYQPGMRYRRLGTSDIYLSVISLGGIGLKREIALYAIDHGVNLIHMSSTYNFGSSMKVLGSILKDRRDKVYIALKDSFYRGSIHDIDKPLKTMNTDYVDFLMFNRHDASKVDDPRIYEIFEKWRAQGKVRLPGLTTHEDVKACVAVALQGNFYRIVQPALNQPNLELLQPELQLAQQRGIGIMAMKTMKGISDELQASLLKKILLNPAITTVNKGFDRFDKFDLFLKATQESFGRQEDIELYRYAQSNRTQNCMMCGQCKRVCPQRIEIPTLLRCKEYYYDQLGEIELAMEVYQSIPVERRFDSCDRCGNCERACPNAIPILQRLGQAFVTLEGLKA